MKTYLKDNPLIGVLAAVFIIALIIFAFKGCDNKSAKEGDEPLDYFAQGAEQLNLADKNFQSGERSRAKALRAQQGFANKYGDQGNLENYNNVNNNQSAQNLENCPTCPQDEKAKMREAKEIALSEVEFQKDTRRLAGVEEKSVQKSSSKSSSGTRIIYRDRVVKEQPRPVINNYYGSEKSSSSTTRAESTHSTVTSRKSSHENTTIERQKENCIGCEGGTAYSEEIRQRQLESKRNGYRGKICVPIMEGGKQVDMMTFPWSKKGYDDAVEFFKNSGGLKMPADFPSRESLP